MGWPTIANQLSPFYLDENYSHLQYYQSTPSGEVYVDITGYLVSLYRYCMWSLMQAAFKSSPFLHLCLSSTPARALVFSPTAPHPAWPQSPLSPDPFSLLASLHCRVGQLSLPRASARSPPALAANGRPADHSPHGWKALRLRPHLSSASLGLLVYTSQ